MSIMNEREKKIYLIAFVLLVLFFISLKVEKALLEKDIINSTILLSILAWRYFKYITLILGLLMLIILPIIKLREKTN